MNLKLTLWIALGAALLGGFIGYQIHRPAPPAKLVTQIIHDAAKAETVYVAHHDTLVKWLTKYAQVRDTLNIHDTTQVIRYVQVADSTIHACQGALSACDATLTAKNLAITALQDAQPSRAHTIIMAVLWGVAGATADRLIHH